MQDFQVGTHTLRAVAKDNDGATAEVTVNIKVSKPLGLDQKNVIKSLVAYPNPVSENNFHRLLKWDLGKNWDVVMNNAS